MLVRLQNNLCNKYTIKYCVFNLCKNDLKKRCYTFIDFLFTEFQTITNTESKKYAMFKYRVSEELDINTSNENKKMPHRTEMEEPKC